MKRKTLKKIDLKKFIITEIIIIILLFSLVLFIIIFNIKYTLPRNLTAYTKKVKLIKLYLKRFLSISMWSIFLKIKLITNELFNKFKKQEIKI